MYFTNRKESELIFIHFLLSIDYRRATRNLLESIEINVVVTAENYFTPHLFTIGGSKILGELV